MRFEWDLGKVTDQTSGSTLLALSPMTHARNRKLARLAARPDSKINLSEIPPFKESSGETLCLRVRAK
jgi:hypothetical protein